MSTEPAPRPLRVMQSFGAPRPTSNPYVHMLDRALAATPGVEHLRLDRRRALLGRYDVLHVHWPETLLGGGSPSRRILRRAYAAALRARLERSEVAVVRTVHNVEAHEERAAWERRWLEWLERRTDHRVLLVPSTPVPDGAPTTLVPHGHYRDWYASVPRREPTPDALAAVGLVRRYKGLEQLVAAFGATAADAPELRLRIAGHAPDAPLAASLRRAAALDPRIALDLRHLSEHEFATAVMEASGVVLPYRAMHSSGAALAALSLGRPVLVPRNDATDALAAEVGRGWVHGFDGELGPEDLRRFVLATRDRPAAAPDLAARDWSTAGEAHAEAWRRAVERRRAGRRR